MERLKAYFWQFLCLALVVFSALQWANNLALKADLSDANRLIASERLEASQQALATSSRYRKAENDLRSEFETQAAKDRATIALLEADRKQLAATGDSLRDTNKRYLAAIRAATTTPGAIAGVETALAAVDLQSQLYARADSEAAILGEALDRSYAAGLSCERRYDAAVEKFKELQK